MIVRAPAKINIFLEVTSRRKDGYHNIESLMRPVSLYDRLVIKPQSKDVTLRCNLKDLPVDDSNIVMKAAILLKNELNIDKGAHIYLEKNIPMGAGLGGGSSDAAAVLNGLLRLWKRRLSQKKLLSLAKKLGADVPFFVIGGSAVARGIGEKLTRVKNLAPAYVLLVNPGFGIATAKVYKKLRFPLTKKQKINRILKLLKHRAQFQEWAGLMFNRLEEAVLKDYPEIGRIKEVFKFHGYSSLMSGSGSTVFGLIGDKKAAEKLKPEFERLGCKSWMVKTIA